MHVHRRVIRAIHDRPIFELSLRPALIDVGLGNEDGEGNIVDTDVGPGDVLRKTLPADP